MKKLVVLVLGAIVLNAGLIFLGRGDLVHLIGVAMAVAYVGLPLLVLSVGLLVFAVARRPARGKLRLVALWGLTLAVLVGSTLISLPFGRLVLHYDITAAKQHCEELVPILDEYREEHGHYPKSLSELQRQTSRPYLLEDGFYRSDGKAFRFSFWNPSGLLNGFLFSSADRKWDEWD